MSLKFLTVAVVPPETVAPPEHKVLVGEPLVVDIPMSVVNGLLLDYIKIYRPLAAIDGKKLIKKLDEIRKALEGEANKMAPDHVPVTFTCQEGTLEFSERSNAVEVIAPQDLVQYLADKYGLDVAFSVVKIGMGELRKVLSDLEMEPFVLKTKGSRTLKSVNLVP